MVKIALIDDEGGYNALVASGSDTPYQILTHHHINPQTRKVFINGKLIAGEKFNSPLSGFQSQGSTIFIRIKF